MYSYMYFTYICKLSMLSYYGSFIRLDNVNKHIYISLLTC